MTTKTMISVPVSFLYMTKQEANVVELAGSFNNWTKVAMERGPREWSITVVMPPGKYEYKFIVDNKWIHSEEKPTTKDGMGGLNNVFTVDEKQDLKSAIMVALEADFEKLKDKGKLEKLDWDILFHTSGLVKEQHMMDLDDCKELLSRIEEDVNKKMGSITHGNCTHNLPEPLTVAATYGWEEVCKVLLSEGASINETSWHYQDLPLMTAAKVGWPNICELLVLAGADINLKIEQGYGKNALDIAKENNNTEVVAVLEKYGASVSEISLNQILEFHSISLAEIDQIVEDTGNTPLFFAVGIGNKDAIKLLLDAGADVDKLICDGNYTCLLYAVQFGQSDICRMLISEGADVNKPEWDTPLYRAAENGNADICQMLIEAGADVNKQNNLETTPLIISLEKGYPNIAMMLLSAGAEVNKNDGTGVTTLFLASKFGYVETVKKILEKEPSIAAAPSQDREGNTPLMAAAENGHTEVCKLLLQGGAGAGIDKQTFEEGDTALIKAANEDRPEICEILLSAGADINKRNYHHYGYTALDIAKEKKYSKVVAVLEKHETNVSPLQIDHILTKHEISVDHLDKEFVGGVIEFSYIERYTPLMYATRIRNVDACKLLIKAGANANKANEYGKSPIWIASEYGCPDICQILIEAGADVNKEYDSRTPILMAISNYVSIDDSHYADTVKILINAGAKLNEHAKYSSLQWAILRKDSLVRHSLIKMLIEGGADVDLIVDDETPLMTAAKLSYQDDCKLLIECGAQIDKENNDRSTALAFAAKNKDTKICKMLINKGANIEKLYKAYNGKSYKGTILTYVANLDKE